MSLHTELMSVAHPERLQYLQNTPCASFGKKRKKAQNSNKSLNIFQTAQTTFFLGSAAAEAKRSRQQACPSCWSRGWLQITWHCCALPSLSLQADNFHYCFSHPLASGHLKYVRVLSPLRKVCILRSYYFSLEESNYRKHSMNELLVRNTQFIATFYLLPFTFIRRDRFCKE